jgi:argininosuccinate lyase
MTAGAERLWGGRFTAGPAPALDRVNRSLPVDRRLWPEDIAGSEAWVRALGEAGVLADAEVQALSDGLGRVRRRLQSWGSADWDAAPDEDIHSLVERLLKEEAGEVAGKLHTGRSRNDQVATDGRLWARGAAARLDVAIQALEGALVDQAERHVETLMPAHTHLQPAQPVTAGHWLLSHAWALERDRARLADAADRASTLVLGSGAVAGCPFPIDRRALARELGFARVADNSMDAVADRDWAAELLFVCSLLGVHLSRLAEDLIVFASEPFGFVRLSDRFTTGSSLMPQKRNPDGLELARGKAGVLMGQLMALLASLKGTPSGYNKDLQEDKALLFAAFDTLEAVLPAVTGTVATLEVRADRCAAAIAPALMATDLADLLVGRGVPFRVAHEAVGRLLLHADEAAVEHDARGAGGAPTALAAMAVEEWAELAPDLDPAAVAAALDPRASVERRDRPGGTAPARVREQIASLRAAWAADATS